MAVVEVLYINIQDVLSSMNEEVRMGTTRMTKKSKGHHVKKGKSVLFKLGIGIAMLQMILSVVFIVMMYISGMLPALYAFLISTVLVLCVAGVMIAQRWKVSGIITKILSVFLSFVLAVGCVYLGTTMGVLRKMSGEHMSVSVIGVYVLSSDSAETIQDIAGYSCGVLTNFDMSANDKMKSYIADDMGVSLNYRDYHSVAEIARALYSGEADAIFLNENYISILSEMPEFEGIDSKIKKVCAREFKTEVDIRNNGQYISGNDVITIYISGIDTYGAPSVTSRSDVNIICSINTKTHQILLVNTPRDFYVPLSVSGGIKDKLTHAGIYGVDCSLDTLSMLYGIQIDYYLKLNFTGFMKIIDKLGGVDVYSDYAFTSSHIEYSYNKGINHLNGTTALAFARERYAFASGDRQRGENQMAVIKAVLAKMTTMAMITNYTSILDSLSDSVITNMPYDQIADLCQMQIHQMPDWDVQSFSVNGTGEYNYTFSISDMQVYVMNPDYELVNQATEYFRRMCDNEIIHVE